MLELVLLSIILVSQMFYAKTSRQAGFVFGLSFFLYIYIGRLIPDGNWGTLYYLASAGVSGLIIRYCSRLVGQTNVVTQIIRASRFIFYINLLGWALFMWEYDPIYYDLICLLLFIAVLIMLIDKGINDNVRDHTLACRHFGFCSDPFPDYSRLPKSKETKEL